MSQIDALLSRLSKVKGRNGAWTACCPAHDDKSPSLAIREHDGKILLKCFGGCEASNIVAALGMDMTDLFPPPEPRYQPQPKVKFFASDLLRVIHFEAQVVLIAAHDIAKGKKISTADADRLKLAYQRIDSAMEAAS